MTDLDQELALTLLDECEAEDDEALMIELFAKMKANGLLSE